MKLKLLVAVAALLVTSCDYLTDIDTSGMDPMPDFADIDFSRIQPAQSFEYWEVRFSWGAGSPRDSVLGSGGTRTRAQIDTATLRVLDSTRPPTGFAQGCLPAHCYMYVVGISNGVKLYSTVDALRQFLAPIQTREEAMLMLRARGFYWDPRNGGVTGMRAVGDEWEFAVLELVRDCAPVQTDRVLVRVRRDGAVDERDREVWEKSPNACI